jgi:hypothetical protein
VDVAFFEGSWTLSRSISDGTSFSGVATLVRVESSRLQYEEAGLTRVWSGESMDAKRSYIYEIGADHLHVMFDDGRTFLRLRPGVADVHQCGNDTYTATFAIKSPDVWTMTIDVKGPHKNAVIKSVFKRVLS